MAIALRFGKVDEGRTTTVVSTLLLARGALAQFVIACSLVILGRAAD